MDITFPESYEASRARFIRDFELLHPKWDLSLIHI